MALKDNPKKGIASIALLEVGLFEIGFVVVVIVIILGVLNYFNIISLSQLYPDKLGLLPHQVRYKEVTVQRLPKPQELSKERKTYAVNGFFNSRTGESFTITSSTGVMTFNFDKNTTFLKIDTSKSPSETKQYTNAEEFFQQIKSGELLFVTYSSREEMLRAEQVQYISSYQK